MDLDTIQDLLGGSNLPPPPSVQDLLGDVVPIPASPSPPPVATRLYVEHSYSKAAMEGSVGEEETEQMEQETVQTQGSQSLAQLGSTTDCYEAFLLNLLRVYTQNKIDSHTASGDSTNPSSTSQPNSDSASTDSEVFTIDSISPEAISALSQEQIQSLVTSNSTNYDVIHQILAFKQKMEGGGGGGGGGVSESGETGETGEKSEGEKDEVPSALQQLQSLQLTSEQLKQIQMQMSELIRTKQIVLPAELSLDQQQQLLQSLILKQIQAQQQSLLTPQQSSTTTAATTASTPQTTATVSTPTAQPQTPVSTGTTPSAVSTAASNTSSTQTGPQSSPPGTNSQPTVGNTLAAMLRGDSETSAGSAQGGGDKTQHSTNPVTDGDSQASPAAPPSTVTTRSGGRKKRDVKDPDEPKKPSSPYGVFFSDVYPSVLQANPRMSFSEASKLISAMWNAMGLDTKKQYHERAEKQKATYQAYLASRKAETTPTEEVGVESPQTPGVGAGGTRTLGQTTEQLATGDLTGKGGEVVENSAESRVPTAAAAPPVPPPAPTSPRVALKDTRHCINDGCFNVAVYTEFRGARYCSNECVVQHCRSVFQEWVAQRKVAT